MKKGIARVGLICSLSLFTQSGFTATVGDLLISEIMPNPAAISDTRGEWFELFNPTQEQINLRGIELRDDGSNRHRFDTDLLILPGEYFTLARSSEPGFVPDYVYGNFTLSNGSDEIVFQDGLLELLRLDYGAGFALAGRSRKLLELPATAANYGLTLASLGYGAGDIGTPGTADGWPLTPSAVPIPAAVWLFLSGAIALLLPSRWRRTPLRFAVIPGLSEVVSNRRDGLVEARCGSLQS
jgi:hypothetical protein